MNFIIDKSKNELFINDMCTVIKNLSFKKVDNSKYYGCSNVENISFEVDCLEELIELNKYMFSFEKPIFLYLRNYIDLTLVEYILNYFEEYEGLNKIIYYFQRILLNN